MNTQYHRKGHVSHNKAVSKSMERSQRYAAKLCIARGGKMGHKKARPAAAKVKTAKTVAAYPCGPKQMTLGELPRSDP